MQQIVKAVNNMGCMIADTLKAMGESLGQSINKGENELVKQKLLQLKKRLEDQEKKVDE